MPKKATASEEPAKKKVKLPSYLPLSKKVNKIGKMALNIVPNRKFIIV